MEEPICDCDISHNQIKQHEEDIKNELKNRELNDINRHKLNYIGSDMKPKPREPEILYRDNYDPVGYPNPHDTIINNSEQP